MKSIMEEANSAIKAIEKAWYRADKPSEFSVKIFEQEEKNFFGITSKQAKIGIFFKEKETKLRKFPPSKEAKKITSPKKELRKQPKQSRHPELRIQE